MARELVCTVYVTDETGTVQKVGPGPVDPALAGLITNPDAWEGEDDASPESDAKPPRKTAAKA